RGPRPLWGPLPELRHPAPHTGARGPDSAGADRRLGTRRGRRRPRGLARLQGTARLDAGQQARLEVGWQPIVVARGARGGRDLLGVVAQVSAGVAAGDVLEHRIGCGAVEQLGEPLLRLVAVHLFESLVSHHITLPYRSGHAASKSRGTPACARRLLRCRTRAPLPESSARRCSAAAGLLARSDVWP